MFKIDACMPQLWTVEKRLGLRENRFHLALQSPASQRTMLLITERSLKALHDLSDKDQYHKPQNMNKKDHYGILIHYERRLN